MEHPRGRIVSPAGHRRAARGGIPAYLAGEVFVRRAMLKRRTLMTPEEFRRLGHQIIDRIADYRATVAR